jgi:RND family efflux transporter MFP subunit
MSDRLLVAGAAFPMVLGALAVGFLQRGPSISFAASPAESTPLAHAAPPVASERPWVGVVIAGSTAELAADAAGRVAQVVAQTGTHVAQGDPILQLDRADVAGALGVVGAEVGQRRADVDRAQARYEAATSRLARLKAGEAWLSQQELDTARSEARVARAELAAARASLDMGGARYAQQRLRVTRSTVVAPFAGTLVTSDVAPGDSVAAGQILARVFSADRQVRFAVSRDHLPLAGAEVLVTLPRSKTSVRARVASLRPEVDPSAQLVFATAPLPREVGPAAWMPGTPVDVTVASSLSP